MAVALAALNAQVRIAGSRGERTVAVETFYLLPGATPDQETTVRNDELIVDVQVPASASAKRSTYYKVRDRTSYAFALISLGAALDIQNGIVRDIRLVAGGVAHKPWRLKGAEATLLNQPLDEKVITAAMDATTEGARPLAHNQVKVDLLRRVTRAVLEQFRKREQ